MVTASKGQLWDYKMGWIVFLENIFIFIHLPFHKKFVKGKFFQKIQRGPSMMSESIPFFVLVDPYPFNAVKRVWIDQNKKGHGSTKKSLTVHTVYFCCFLLLFNFLKIQLVLLQKVYCHEVANVHGHILCPHFLVVHKKVKSFLKKNSSFDFT